MTIYEELKELEKEAEREKRNTTYSLSEREYFAGMAAAYREAIDLFDGKRRPEENIAGFSPYNDVSDFLPPERK